MKLGVLLKKLGSSPELVELVFLILALLPDISAGDGLFG
jgi:hypothetical protein